MMRALSSDKKAVGVTLLFSVTLFLSAALMFTVQPMAGKMLLPLFGGTPSAWLAAMAYFQASLLGGYFLAFLLSRLSPQRQMGAVILLLMAGFAVQPLRIAETGALGDDGPLAVVMLLAASLSLPFLAISSLSPSLQRLFACRSDNPYFLFAASNLGSFIGLLAYPFVLERWTGLGLQAEMWRWVYGALIFLCAGCLFALRGKKEASREAEKKETKGENISWRQKALWVFLSFVPSSLMMGVTARVTMDTGAVPLFWVLPLALYLLTLVQAFAEKDSLATIKKLLPFQILLTLLILVPSQNKDLLSSLPGVMILLLTFVIAARTFHAFLAQARPSPNSLTQYYLWLSLGGALGGSFNAFLVPWLFPASGEFTFVLLAGLLFLLCQFREKDKKILDASSMIIVAVTLAFFAGFALLFEKLGAESNNIFLFLLQLAVVCGIALFCARPSVAGVVLLCAGFLSVSGQMGGALEVKRNFFGLMKVVELVDGDKTIRRLVHGTTLHGTQQVAPIVRTNPNGYFVPVGDILDSVKARNVGMIGFGVGTSLCHTAPDRRFTVYEIDPDVVDIADRRFDFIRNCGKPTVKIGDGRKVLEADVAASYDAFIVDAFSSDAIPVHLLTQEALKVYLSRLKEKGVLAFHISNRFYDLEPQLSALARSLGLKGVFRRDDPDRVKEPLATKSVWVVVSREDRSLSSLREKGWLPLSDSNARVWTDDHSDALSALRIGLMK